MAGEFIPYPWLDALWRGLLLRKGEGRLPHALLFSGPSGLGKQHLASGLAQSILCENPLGEGTACGQCRSCKLFRAGTHPDYLLIQPEEDKKSIVVDQVRKLDAFQAMKGHYAHGKVIVIAPADRMNINASNALLKTLEEPTAGTVLILSTDRPMTLLATIRSRCQQVVFAPAARSVAGPWLKQQLSGPVDEQSLLAMAADSPLLALEWADTAYQERREKLFAQLEQIRKGADPLTVASEWSAEGKGQTLAWFYSWVSDMIRLKNNPETATLANPHLRERLQALAERVDLNALFRLLESVQEGIRLLLQTQVNALLVMEALLLDWSRIK